MPSAKRRYSSLIMFSVTLLLAVGISSAMYFFKIQKNEDYQNRLHFRELNEVSRSISQSAGQLSEIAKVCESAIKAESPGVELANTERDNDRLDATPQQSIKQDPVASCENLLKNRVALANRSANLKSLKISTASPVTNAELLQHAIHFHADGTTYIAVKSQKDDSADLSEAVEHAEHDDVDDLSGPGQQASMSNTPAVLPNILEVQTRDFIPANIERFPLVLIADAKGMVIGSRQVNRKGVETADLQFQEINSLLVQIAEQRALAKKKEEFDSKFKPTTSEILDTTIGGVDYRIFVQPSNLTAYDTDSEKLYLLGLVPANELRLAKLRVSPNTALWFVLILIGLISLLPVLKLRFVSVKYAFSKGDVSQIGMGMIVALGMLSIGVTHQLFYGFLMDGKARQASDLHRQITEEFKSEITSLNHWINDYKVRLTPAAINEADVNVPNPGLKDINQVELGENVTEEYCEKIIVNRTDKEESFQSCVDPDLIVRDMNSEQGYDYIVEGTFILNDQGRFAVDTQTTWKQRKLLVGRDISLAHRQYFQQAIECDVWGDTKIGAECDKGLVFERINNVRDGRKNTQFAIPMFKNVHDDSNAKQVLSFGTRLRTFFHRVMPKNFGYLVFEDSGKVLFHSDEQRSLIENVFVETDNNKQLHAFVENKSYIRGDTKQTINFEAVYRGKSHLFAVGKLFTDSKYKAAPLTLVVFFDQSDAELNNMLLLFLAVILFLIIIIPLFVYFRYATSQAFWATLLYFNPKHARRYLSWMMLIIGGAVFCLFMMGLVFDLALRIAIWLLTVCLIFKLIVLSIDPKGTVIRGDSPSIKPAVGLAVLFASIWWGLGAVPPNLSPANIAFFVIGVGFLIATIAYQVRKPQRKVRQEELYSRERYNKAYVGFLVAILFFIAAVPASLIINSANGYLLQHQATLQSQNLLSAQRHYQTQLADYDAIVGISSHSSQGEFKAKNWLSHDKLEKAFPGYCEWIYPEETGVDKGRYTDKMIQFLVSNIAFADALLAEITHLAKTDQMVSDMKQDSRSKKTSALADCVGLVQSSARANEADRASQPGPTSILYLPDEFMLQASNNNTLFILFSLLIQLFVLHRITELMIVRRLFGDHLTNDFRISYPTEHYCLGEKWDCLFKQLNQTDAQQILLLHSNATRVNRRFIEAKKSLFSGGVLNIKNCLKQVDDKFELENRLNGLKNESPITVALEGYDELAFLPERRNLALELTQRLVVLKHVHIIIVADTAPIYRLIKQDEYPHLQEESVALATEELAWSNIFSRFDKMYDWTPAKKYMPRQIDDVLHLIENEANGWPELREIEASFKQYHRLVKLLDENAEVTANNLKQYWRPSQIIAYFAMHAGALYRMKWELCTKDERYLLYQLASGANVNPLNSEVLEHLMRRGYIYRDAGWHVLNDSFKRFVLHAEREESIAEWQNDANTGIWSMLRIPIFTVVLVLIVVTVFSSGQAIDSALGILTALLGMIPLLLRNVSLLKGGSTNLGE